MFDPAPPPEIGRMHPLAPVVAIDVDGTLADYYDHFRWFAQLYLQRSIRNPMWNWTDEFSEALGMDKELYRDIKLAYRQGGMKRSIPPLDGFVKHLVQGARAIGVQVWICTTRPWQRLDNIDPDTQFWLNNNCGRVDGVIYGEDKYADLIDIVGQPRILGVFDDLNTNIERASALGLKAVLRTGAHNLKHVEKGPNASGSREMLDYITQWKAEYDNADRG